MTAEPVASAAAPTLTGFLTFLFTDVEGSTRRWVERSDDMHEAMAIHDRVLREVVAEYSGQVVKFMGDGVMAVFASPDDAVQAAIDAQRQVELPVRMGLHCGIAAPRDGDYFGVCVNRAARLMGVAHGGQIVVSQDLAPLLTAVELVDLGPHRLKDMPASETVFQVLHPELRAEFPALNALRQSQHNLTRPTSALLGRDTELDQLGRALGEVRVVSIVGAGGLGKTRLALEMAWRSVDSYVHGVHFVELAALTDGAQLPDAIGRAVGLRLEMRRAEVDDIVAHYREREALLVLDNCEHLVDDVARLVARLVSEAPTVKVLATSRSTLGVAGEQVVRPQPMVGDVASALFIARARAVRPDLLIDDDDVAAIAAICERLDHLPLAIELAAAQTVALSVPAILDRLDSALEMSVRRGSNERHRTLRDMVRWSATMLSDDDRALFYGLSVCRGSIPLEAVERIGTGGPSKGFGGITSSLAALVDSSLVEADARTGRYRLLEPVRQYAAAELAGTPAESVACDRHAGWARAMVERMSTEVLESLLDLDASDLANIRAAVSYMLARNDPAAVLELIVAGGELWSNIIVADDVEEWLERALDAGVELPIDLKVQAISQATHSRVAQDPGPRAIRLGAMAVELAEHEAVSVESRFQAIHALSTAYLHDNAGHPRTMEWCVRALDAARPHRSWERMAHTRIAIAAFLAMDPAAGLSSADANAATTDLPGMPVALRQMAHGFRAPIRAYLGDREGALEDLAIIHDVAPSVAPRWRGTIHSTAATAWERLGDQDEMVRHLVPGLRLTLGDVGQVVAVTIGAVAVLAERVPSPLVAYAVGSLESYHTALQPMLAHHIGRARERAIEHLGDDEYHVLHRAGSRAPLDEAHQLLVRALLGLEWTLPPL
jgi:predicted ATPase/class 3 adenylate cyclase